MEFDLSIRKNTPKLLSLFPESPCLQSERLTAQRSVLIPPQHNHHLNFHHHILNVPHNNDTHAALGIEGHPHTSICTTPFSSISIPTNPTLAQSSKPTIDSQLRSDFFTNHTTLAPNTKINGLNEQTNSPIQSSATLINDDQVQNHSNIANNIKGKWTPDEDIELMQLVNQHGLKKWILIEKLMKGRRDAKQCRERYLHHLSPNIKKDRWTLEEDMILIKAHQEVGNKWATIAKRLPGRSENTVKNHWSTTKKRQSFTIQKKSTAIVDNEGSLLHAYIRKVTATEESTKKLKNNISHEMNMNMSSSGCEMQTNCSTIEFNSKGSMETDSEP